MAFRKYQKSEKVEVVASADAPETLRKFGVTSCTCYPGMCPQGCEPACPLCSSSDQENLTES